ncbi:Biotinidase [Gossypium arboreum]|uniref:Biotinidase n=1 Tax=Gossypium arboreum TaxID=29729 RepID=A0A0B0MX85_GOSAR|nr:Biotinidase [Gossypium arboreum]
MERKQGTCTTHNMADGHVPDMVLHWLSHLRADAMSQRWSYIDTSHSQCMSQTCLTLAYISRPMHVLDMSYTSSCLNVVAMS